MFETFYWQTSRKLTAVFGTLFNNIHVERRDNAGALIQSLKVPLAYAPKARYLARLNSDVATSSTEPSVKLTLPRMSFILDGFEYDPSRQINPLNYKSAGQPADFSVLMKILNPIPINYNFSLSCYSKNMEDGLMMIEQIVPYFQPHINVSIKDIPLIDFVRDVPIIMESSSTDDNYEGGFDSDERIISWDFQFVARSYMYPPIRDTKVIQKVVAYIGKNAKHLQGTGDDGLGLTPEEIFARLSHSNNPFPADIDGVFAVDEEILEKNIPNRP